MTAPASSAERLRRSPDVRRALRRGQRRRGRHVVAHVLDRGDHAVPRVAVVATRRVGGAVQRNRAKRVLRAAGRDTSLPLGTDVVLVARTSATSARMQDVLADLEHLFES